MVKQMDLREDLLSRKQHLIVLHSQLMTRNNKLMEAKDEVKHEAMHQLERSVMTA
jgi:hypothetical protein